MEKEIIYRRYCRSCKNTDLSLLTRSGKKESSIRIIYYHLCRPCNNKYSRNHYKKHPDIVKKAIRKYEANNKLKRYAWDEVSKALSKNRLLKPLRCERCITTGRLHAHHIDYKKPLTVNWLCPKCHSIEHKL